MSRRAVTTVLGLGAAGAGYYLYQAGGDSKVAEKQFQKDVAKLTDNKSGEAQKEGEALASSAREKLDNAYQDAKTSADKYSKDLQGKIDKGRSDASSKLQELRSETGKAIDQFDATVEKKASEAKSGISSWWGGSKK